MDHLVTATAAGGTLRVHAAVTTELVAEARGRHDLAPTASAALGRLLTASALMGGSLKGAQRVVLQVAGDGPLRNLLAEAFPDGEGLGVRGYALHPEVDLPLSAAGKFDVGAAVGSGVLQVTRTLESGQPYTGIVRLVSGEIGDDVAAYFAQSEQTPCVVALGVLANPAGILAAGGIVAELLPGAADHAVDQLERAAAALPPVTSLVREGASPWDLVQRLVGDLEPKHLRRLATRFACRCSREKIEVAIRGLGPQALREMACESRPQTVTCEYCARVYEVTPDEVAAIAAR
ncbi:MAG TPA: Hsp33 family molecular chaperone HslO [Candidatus Dormibacteraeota bacterium]|nr:Hsp33 family molecular chaperone HslO [Candidatus Dormibacteraeota bacterium]